MELISSISTQLRNFELKKAYFFLEISIYFSRSFFVKKRCSLSLDRPHISRR